MPHASPNANATQAIGRSSWRFLGRAILILLLIPLLAASWGMRIAMPPADLRAEFDGRRPFVYWNIVPDVHNIYTGDPHKANDEPIKVMNIETGEITSSTRASLVWHAGVNSRGERLAIGGPQSLHQALQNSFQGIPNPPPERRCAYFKNMETGETRRVEFDRPPAINGFHNGETINSRYFVCRDRNNIYAIDLEDDQPQIFSAVVPYSGTDLQVKHIYGTDLLYEIHPPSQSSSTRHKLELFKLADHQIQLVKSFEIGCSGITKLDGQLLTLSVDGTQVEIHSLEDFTLMKTIDISEQFLASHTVIELQGNLLIAANKQDFNYDYYDVFAGEQLKLPFSGMHFRWWSGERFGLRYWCFGGGKGWREKYAYVYDLKEQRVCLEVPHDCKVSFLEDGRFAVSYPAYGVCTEVYDLETGKSIRQAPYQWYAVAQAALLLAWFGWWVTWLVVSAREGGWVWLDLTLIFAIVPGLLICTGVGKLLKQSAFLDLPSADFSVVFGVFMGLLCISATYLMAGREKRSVTLLPLTIVFATMSWWLSSYRLLVPGATEHMICSRAFINALLNTLGIVAATMVVRTLGCRFETAGNSRTDKRHPPVSLLDLFAVVACSAVALVASQPLFMRLPQWQLSLLYDWYWFPTTLGATLVSFVVTLTIMHQRILLFRCGCVFAATLWCVLVLHRVLIFAAVPGALLFIQPTSVLTIAVASTSSFLCALAFRLRNYRLRPTSLSVSRAAK